MYPPDFFNRSSAKAGGVLWPFSWHPILVLTWNFPETCFRSHLQRTKKPRYSESPNFGSSFYLYAPQKVSSSFTWWFPEPWGYPKRWMVYKRKPPHLKMRYAPKLPIVQRGNGAGPPPTSLDPLTSFGWLDLRPCTKCPQTMANMVNITPITTG